jgi:hypothetical protein
MKHFRIAIIILLVSVGIGVLAYIFVDKRALLTSENFYQVLNEGADECNQFGVLNHDEPTSYIKYSKVDGGVEFAVPYNKKWGNKKYKLTPYDEYNTPASPVGRRIVFGSLECFAKNRTSGDAPWDRSSAIYITPHASVEEILNSGAGLFKASVEEKKIGDLAVFLIKYNGQSDCDERVVVRGKKYDYDIVSFEETCSTAEKIYEKNLRLISSIKILE